MPSITVCFCPKQHRQLHRVGNKLSWQQPKRDFTFKTVSSELCHRLWEAGLISVAVHGPDTEKASTALNPGNCNRMSGAAIREPAVVASVQTLTPGGVELPGRCQDSIPPLTLFAGLLKGHLLGHGSVIHFTCKTHGKGQHSLYKKSINLKTV